MPYKKQTSIFSRFYVFFKVFLVKHTELFCFCEKKQNFFKLYQIVFSFIYGPKAHNPVIVLQPIHHTLFWKNTENLPTLLFFFIFGHGQKLLQKSVPYKNKTFLFCFCYLKGEKSGYGLMANCLPSKQKMRVRFPLSAMLSYHKYLFEFL